MKHKIVHKQAPVKQVAQQAAPQPSGPIQPTGQTASMDPSFPGAQDPLGNGIPDLANYGRMIHGGA